MASTKVCAVCKVEQPVENFGPDKCKKDGHRSYCRECDRRLARERGMKVKEKTKVFVAEKVCLDCNTLKPRSEFHFSNYKSDGLSSYCKECNSKRNIETRKNLKSKEPTVEHKVCPTCGTDKPASEFYLAPKRGDGLNWECKGCTKGRVKGWAENNPEIKEANDQRHYEIIKADGRMELYRKRCIEKNPGIRNRWAHNYRENHREHINEYMRLYRWAHPEVHRKARQKWTKNNPEKNRIKVQRRNTRKRELPFDLKEQDVEDLMELFEDSCAFCDVNGVKLTLEHVVPLNRRDVPNPGTVRGNLIPLCKACNSSKNDKLLEEYLLDERLLRPEIKAYLRSRGMSGKELAEEIRYSLDVLAKT